MVTTWTLRPPRAYPAAAIAPESVFPSPVPISMTSPAIIRSAPSNWTSNGRRPVARSAATRAMARNCGASAAVARSARFSNRAALASCSSSRPAALSAKASDADTSAIECAVTFSSVAPSSRQKPRLSRPWPDEPVLEVFTTGTTVPSAGQTVEQVRRWWRLFASGVACRGLPPQGGERRWSHTNRQWTGATNSSRHCSGS